MFAAQGFVSHAMVILPLVLTGAATQYAGARASLFFVAIAGLIITTALESARVRLRRPAVPAGGAPMLAPAVVESTDR